MDDILFVRRVKFKGVKPCKGAVIRLEFPQGRFALTQELADVLGIDAENGLMFGFNKKAQTAYVVKDDEPDAFIVRRKDAGSLRFCSKDLQGYFDNTFGLSECTRR